MVSRQGGLVGKQIARIYILSTLEKTIGSSSPLGQLLDHGCDAISTVIILFTTMQVLKFGAGIPYFVFTIASFSVFYLANWEESHTGCMRLNYKGLVGITEALYLIATVLLT